MVKPEEEKTWENMKTHFIKAQKTRWENRTTGSTGYVNNIQTDFEEVISTLTDTMANQHAEAAKMNNQNAALRAQMEAQAQQINNLMMGMQQMQMIHVNNMMANMHTGMNKGFTNNNNNDRNRNNNNNRRKNNNPNPIMPNMTQIPFGMNMVPTPGMQQENTQSNQNYNGHYCHTHGYQIKGNH